MVSMPLWTARCASELWVDDVAMLMVVQDQESSSEDMMHAYALKMWGKVTGNADLEAR